MYQTEILSKKIGNKIASILELDKNQQEVVTYGAFNLIQVFWSLIIVIVAGKIFNVLIEGIIISFSINLLRKYSGGVHATSPNRCAIIGAIITTGMALVAARVLISLDTIYIICIFVFGGVFGLYNVYELAPVDSPEKPIKKFERKQHLKKWSLIIFSIEFVVIIILLVLFIKYHIMLLLVYGGCIFLGIMWQSFTLTEVGHKTIINIDAVFKYII